MERILPNLDWWTTSHPVLGIEVSSYWREDAGVVFDPLVLSPADLDWFAARPVPPSAILLSNRHHYRSSRAFVARFGCPVYCHRDGLHEFTADQHVLPFAVGDHLPGGVVACEVGAICPDDTALYLPAQRAMLFADGLVAGGVAGTRTIGFVPDVLMDDPADTKARLLAAFRRLLDAFDFEHLLLAHGGPVIDTGRAQLESLISEGGRTAFAL